LSLVGVKIHRQKGFFTNPFLGRLVFSTYNQRLCGNCRFVRNLGVI
jgi:hypothetical protein